jgi:hypothetical protein
MKVTQRGILSAAAMFVIQRPLAVKINRPATVAFVASWESLLFQLFCSPGSTFAPNFEHRLHESGS